MALYGRAALPPPRRVRRGFHCRTCGQYHDDLPMVLGAPAPVPALVIPREERAGRVELSSDQCIVDGKSFYVLGRLVLNVVDAEEDFVWLTWVSLSLANFLRAQELWHVEGRESEPRYFAWIMSDFPAYPETTISLKAELETRPLGERPLVHLEPTEHPLSREQRFGISMARVQQIVEVSLHS